MWLCNILKKTFNPHPEALQTFQHQNLLPVYPLYMYVIHCHQPDANHNVFVTVLGWWPCGRDVQRVWNAALLCKWYRPGCSSQQHSWPCLWCDRLIWTGSTGHDSWYTGLLLPRHCQLQSVQHNCLQVKLFMLSSCDDIMICVCKFSAFYLGSAVMLPECDYSQFWTKCNQVPQSIMIVICCVRGPLIVHMIFQALLTTLTMVGQCIYEVDLCTPYYKIIPYW